MKKYYEIIAIIFISGICTINSAENSKVSFGIHFMLGARYDNLRMCVASPAGVKGGPIADIMFDTKFYINDKVNVTVNIPVMRPILFAAAFKMLQFEPAVTVEFKQKLSENKYFVIGPSLGASFHYGPDYHSDKNNKGDSFFAVGPYISSLFGFQFSGSKKTDKMFGLRVFYIPLFSTDSKLSPGTVFGGAFEGYFNFKQKR